MPVVVLIGAKGAPGVTTSALALTLSWPAASVMVEADPAGGDAQHGLLLGTDLDPARTLVQLALRSQQGRAHLSDAAIALSHQDSRFIVPGLEDPSHEQYVRPYYHQLAETLVRDCAPRSFNEVEMGVLVDAGRWQPKNGLVALLRRADVVLVVMRATIRGVPAAEAAVTGLREEMGTDRPGPTSPFGLLLIGSSPWPRAELEAHLQAPIVGALPDDRTTATALTERGATRSTTRSRLLRAAVGVSEAVQHKALARRESLAGARREGVA